MKKHLALVAPILLILLSACAPAHLTKLKKPLPDEQAEVLVYRQSSANAKFGSMIIGADDADVVKLNINQYAKILLPIVEHTLFARAIGGDQPFKYNVSLVAKQLTCIKGIPNPANYAKAFLPISFYFGNTFVLEQTTRPSKENLEMYEQITIDYKAG